ncbi:MAG: hypothetical protein AB2693_29600 [Candidatus Thiodiazotropha sp.]
MATVVNVAIYALLFFGIYLNFASNMASGLRGRGVRTRGGSGRGRGRGGTSDWANFRADKNFFAVLGEPEQDHTQDGGAFDFDFGFGVGIDTDTDGYTVVRGKQSKRPRISSGGQSGQSGPFSTSECVNAELNDYGTLSNEDKLSLILSKLSVNESRVTGIQNKLDSIIGLKSRILEIETVVNSHADRLKLLEYRSLDLEARSRRRNLLFKGLPENRRENCFEEVRHFIHSKLNIDRDMYLERAHRLGRYNIAKPRPIIVAFRDFCDIDEILNASSQLKGTDFGVSKDFPSEISKARQSLWSQFKTVRANNPNRKVTLGYPAKISVDNETIIDLFPDWFQILQGSRVSRVQSTQANSQNTNTETGLSGLPNLACETPMTMPTREVTSGSHIMGSDSENRETVSPERVSAMQVDVEQFSPSLLQDRDSNEKVSASAADTVDSRAANCKSIPTVPQVPSEQLRGRSLTRKSSQAERQRAKSTVSKSRSSQSRSRSRVGKRQSDVIQPSKFGSKGNVGTQKAPAVVSGDGPMDDESTQLTQMPQSDLNQP